MTGDEPGIVLPPGSETTRKGGGETERGRERAREDERFVPVIVKRTDEARRHPDDVLQVAIREGREQIERSVFSLFLSAVAAGLILGSTAMAVAVVHGAVSPLTDSPALLRLATALAYPLGFVVCMMSGTELFTEHTATAVYPVLDRKAPVRRMLRLWVVVLTGNVIGAAASAGLLILADPVVNADRAYLEIGRGFVAFDAMPLLASAALAGWLMALGAWLILATPPTISQIASIYVVTLLIGLGGLHHSIAGSVEVFAAMMMGGDIGAGQAARSLLLAVAGNLLGGSLFVAVLNYGHIRQSRVVE